MKYEIGTVFIGNGIQISVKKATPLRHLNSKVRGGHMKKVIFGHPIQFKYPFEKYKSNKIIKLLKSQECFGYLECSPLSPSLPIPLTLHTGLTALKGEGNMLKRY